MAFGICTQYVRCGKPKCRCVGGALHGPYFYHFTRENGRLRKRYNKKADVEAEKRALAALKELSSCTPESPRSNKWLLERVCIKILKWKGIPIRPPPRRKIEKA